MMVLMALTLLGLLGAWTEFRGILEFPDVSSFVPEVVVIKTGFSVVEFLDLAFLSFEVQHDVVLGVVA